MPLHSRQFIFIPDTWYSLLLIPVLFNSSPEDSINSQDFLTHFLNFFYFSFSCQRYFHSENFWLIFTFSFRIILTIFYQFRNLIPFVSIHSTILFHSQYFLFIFAKPHLIPVFSSPILTFNFYSRYWSFIYSYSLSINSCRRADNFHMVKKLIFWLEPIG